jgi:hypothetical protein
MTSWLFMNESAVIYDLVIKLGVQCRNAHEVRISFWVCEGIQTAQIVVFD